jgi:DNA-binding CsgD family transcriptional regulator/5-methylcytosine-specific restriction endonuclease McrA
VSAIADQITALRLAGLPSREIAHRLGVAQSTVGYHLRRASESTATPRPELTGPTSRGASRSVPTRTLVEALLRRGLTRAEIAQRLGLAKSTVSYHARRLGAEMDDRCARRFDWRAVQRYYDAGHSVRECARAFGFSTWSWHQAVNRGELVPRPKFRPLEETFAVHSRRNRGHLKTRLLLAGIKSGECERCGLTEWQGEPLSIALHHLNGDRSDNRIENLQLLCPNCHSQTDTFAGRNRGPSRDELAGRRL